MGAGIATELVVAAPKVLHEGVTAHDHAGGVVAFQASHGSKPCFEPAVIGLDAIVRVLRCVVEGSRQDLMHDHEQGPRAIGDHFGGPP